ncbi:probable WRKY transcription factor 49 [Malania oleifera]|uniref:probable WRKY transcription factor 49 n=1 Tax=Malania oleifera TaxID=397392 RepID=UPI0025ADFB09|nr:probable WRKY transcription factor 49 [Malania oleifera]
MILLNIYLCLYVCPYIIYDPFAEPSKSATVSVTEFSKSQCRSGINALCRIALHLSNKTDLLSLFICSTLFFPFHYPFSFKSASYAQFTSLISLEVVLMEELNGNWFDGSTSDDELVRELVDNMSPFFVLPPAELEPEMSPASQAAINQVVSTIYSGPTIGDIENALYVTNSKSPFPEIPESRFPILERNLNKVENKYTLKMKSWGSGMADDGYKWRKYGQKYIKNSRNPRSYYRCTNRRCSAKKQVERSSEDPDALIVTYEGLHLHFAYPCFPPTDNPPPKRPKRTASPPHDSPQNAAHSPVTSTLADSAQEGMSSQGLLEDVVPLVIRCPSNNNTCSNSSSSWCPSPLTSPSSLSWSPNYSPSHFDIGIR